MRISDWSSDVCSADLGQRDPESGVVFPPLWGPDSYNWGAGMARIDTAAGFIKANMPLGKPFSLTDQEAWDVAAFVDSHERPKDPRQTGTLEEARVEFHAGEESFRSEEHTSELQSLMRISYAVFCLKKKIEKQI